MKNKQTATEYFYDRVINIFTKYHEEDVPTIDFGKLITEAFEQAKAMEKNDLFEVFRAGFINGNLIEKKYFNDNKEELTKAAFKSFEHYSTSTYKL
jgi:hypothetical protein